MNLQQKLIEIRKDVVEFTKDTKGYGYQYVSGSQAIRKIRTKMDELGVLLIPSCVGLDNHETFDYTNDKGKEKTDFIVNGDMTYTWQNADNPEETISVPWKYYGAQDDISKAFGSALTYSERYFILKFFQAPTDGDDPDGRNTGNRAVTRKSSSNKTYKCKCCGSNVPENVAKYSYQKFDKQILCMDCQKKNK
ncbi:ERF family protein [Clostridium taeniosporum]|uniref:Recombinase n=1 Tax=Clostridium taeniosporum TaxID=394958 RepID=A0A2I6SDI8_9CLOT|nr:ERF family protein [Clostridium taeniosporum]AUO15634.1 recombinase [Clostridium taeniosporum]